MNVYDKLMNNTINIPSLSGGLGNNMFMIANAFAVSIKENKQLVIPLKDIAHMSQYIDNIFRKLDIYIDYSEENKINNKVFHGYFQDDNNFIEYSEAIKTLFSPSRSFIKKINEQYSFINDATITAISIRRGDYLNYPDYHPTISKNYILKAISLLPQSDYYLIFSDDFVWCKENINLPDAIYIESEPHEQMWTMALCDYFIISNSSFSWWGAYLSRSINKIVLAPESWYGVEGPKTWDEIYCNDWIKIPTFLENGFIEPKNTKKVSCICPTFGKIKELEELIFSYINQTYENKELIIFNNYPNIDFHYDKCEKYNIKIINYKEDIKGSTGECRNLANKYATGDYISVWDDDDIYLPNRISDMVNFLEKNTEYDAYCGSRYFMDGEKIFNNRIEIHMSNIIYRKSILSNYRYTPNNDEDQHLIKYLGDKIYYEKIDKNTKPQYIYKWGNGTYHISGGGYDNYIGDSRDRIMEYTNTLNLPNLVNLNPQYYMDYMKLIENA